MQYESATPIKRKLKMLKKAEQDDANGIMVAPLPTVVVSGTAGQQETGQTLEMADFTGGSNRSTPINLTPRAPRYSEECTA